MAYAPLARRVVELIRACAEGSATPADRLELSFVLGEAGLFEEATAAAGVAAAGYRRAGDIPGSLAAMLEMAGHLAHRGFWDLAEERLARVARTLADLPHDPDLERRLVEVQACAAAASSGALCGTRPPAP